MKFSHNTWYLGKSQWLYSTVQYSTVQYSTVQYSVGIYARTRPIEG